MKMFFLKGTSTDNKDTANQGGFERYGDKGQSFWRQKKLIEKKKNYDQILLYQYLMMMIFVFSGMI